jgi:hypothetical protein
MNKRIYSIGLMILLGVMRSLAGTYTPLEQISIATDRDVYVAGDWVYFSIKVQDQGNHISDFVYLTLSSKQQQHIFSGCVMINNNIASGSFYLTDTLTTGVYQLVSYTNHLRNYGPETFAKKSILVANRFDPDLQKITAQSVSETTDTAFQTEEGIQRARFELEESEKQAHILLGMPVALDNIDAVIDLIRASKTADEAKKGLMTTFNFSEEQATAILDMRLQKLTGLERNKIKQEYEEVLKRIEYLRSALADEVSNQMIKDERKELKENNADGRRSTVENSRFKQPIQLNKEVFSQREPVKLDILLPQETSKAMVSVSVRKLAPVTLTETKSNKEFHNPVNSCYYLPERSGFVLQGSIEPENHASSANKMVFLSCEDSIANLQYTTTDSNGKFRFFLNPYYFGKKIFIRLKGDDKCTIHIEPQYYGGMVGSLPMHIQGDLESYLQMDQKYLSIQRSFNETYHQEQPEKTTLKNWRPAVYSREGIMVRPSDYLYLPDFLNISQELLVYYKIKEKQDDFIGTMMDVQSKEFSVPYIFLDGILLEHVKQIVSLDSKKIKSILTIPNARFMGDLTIPGILDIASTSAEIENIQWHSPIAKLEVVRPLPNSAYKLPEIDKLPRQIPAFLPLLYWNPGLAIDSGNNSSISFYTSDCTGTFEIVVKGFSSDGKEVEFRKLFEVTSIK